MSVSVVIVWCWSLDVFSRRVLGAFASAEIQPLHFCLAPAGLRVETFTELVLRRDYVVKYGCKNWAFVYSTVYDMIVWFLSFYWNKIEVLQQNSQSSQQCQCGWMCGSWLQPACTVNKLQNHKKMDSNLAFWAFPWNLAINYKQNENNYRLYTNPYCTDFIVEGTWENVSRHQLSTEVP